MLFLLKVKFNINITTGHKYDYNLKQFMAVVVKFTEYLRTRIN